MKNKILPAYPGFTRKSITFTIDDGIIKWDEKFIEIVKPHGIRGTFNLCSRSMDREDGFYRSFYDGFGIANHTENHPFAIADDDTAIFSDEFPADQPFSNDVFYRSTRGEGYYMKRLERGWREWANNEKYIENVTNCQNRLVRIFGSEIATGFVWPYCEQNNSEIKAFLKASGFKSIRKTGDVLDKTDFAPPADRMAWSYNANNRNLLEVMEKYATAPDNGKLRFFAFGVHSWDFERDENWSDLVTFSEKYGDRPNDYWYATVDEIFAYLDAMESLNVTEKSIENPSEITLYIELGGIKTTIPPHTTIEI